MLMGHPLKPQTVVITSPNNGDTFNAGDEIEIDWTADRGNPAVGDVYINGGWIGFGTGHVIWDTPSDGSLTGSVEVSVTCNTAVSPTIFITMNAPGATYLNVTEPNGEDYFSSFNDTVNVTWDTDDPAGGYADVYVDGNYIGSGYSGDISFAASGYSIGVHEVEVYLESNPAIVGTNTFDSAGIG